MTEAPSRSDGVATGEATRSSKRFQLPSLNFNFGSLTDGTDIPPPLPSPVQEVPTPPKTPTAEDEHTKGPPVTTNGDANGSKTSPNSDNTATTTGGVKRSIEDGPTSPTSHRGSLRRYLSKSLLNNTYEEQSSTAPHTVSRPPSRTTVTSDRKSKRGSGWFRRLRSTDTNSKRNSMLPQYHQQQYEEVKKEPPPPMIPELSTWESKVDPVIGDDLFKEIK